MVITLGFTDIELTFGNSWESFTTHTVSANRSHTILQYHSIFKIWPTLAFTATDNALLQWMIVFILWKLWALNCSLVLSVINKSFSLFVKIAIRGISPLKCFLVQVKKNITISLFVFSQWWNNVWFMDYWKSSCLVVFLPGVRWVDQY